MFKGPYETAIKQLELHGATPNVLHFIDEHLSHFPKDRMQLVNHYKNELRILKTTYKQAKEEAILQINSSNSERDNNTSYTIYKQRKQMLREFKGIFEKNKEVLENRIMAQTQKDQYNQHTTNHNVLVYD